METCYVALGANLGPAADTVKKAYLLIAAHPDIKQAHCSSLYLTKPVSDIFQPNFINAVCTFQTSLSLFTLFTFLQEVEQMLGKGLKDQNAPRFIDLDLLFYGQHTHLSENLIIPHPRWHERSFVLRPLAELTDEFDVLNKLQQVEDVCLLQL